MRWFALLVAFGLTLTLTGEASAADKTAKKAKKKASKPVPGVVVEVQKDSDAKTGTLTVQLQARKKKQGTAEAPAGKETEKKFRVTAQTRFSKVERIAKGESKRTAATLQDVQKGAKVLIASTGASQDEASSVDIVSRKKAKGTAKQKSKD